MDKETLAKAIHSVGFLIEELRNLGSVNSCELIVVEQLLKKAVEIEMDLKRM